MPAYATVVLSVKEVKCFLARTTLLRGFVRNPELRALFLFIAK